MISPRGGSVLGTFRPNLGAVSRGWRWGRMRSGFYRLSYPPNFGERASEAARRRSTPA